MIWALLLPLIFLLGPSFAGAATVYIDPTCANNGDGTAGSPCAASGGAAGPRNTWVGVTWTAGNTYAGQGGTSETLSSYLVAGSGTAGNPITITSYGTGQFKFRATASYASAIVSRTYITWDNVEFESTSTNCLYLTGVSNNIIVQNSTFTTCGAGAAGVVPETQSATANFDNLLIDGNDFTDLTGPAVRTQFINTNNLQHDSWTISNNLMVNVGSGSNNAGAIHLSMDAGTTATLTNVVISGNTITNVNDEEASPAHAIRLVRSVTGSAHEDRYLGVTIANNTITDGGGGISLAHVGPYLGSRSLIYGNTISNVLATAGIIAFYSNDVEIFDNDITNVQTYAAISNIDGIGIDLDLGNTRIYVYRNAISGCLGNASVENSGQGITIFGSSTNFVYGNTLIGNRHGFVFGDDNAGVAGVPNYVEHNTINGNLWDGIQTVSLVEQVNVIRNNIIANNGRYGISSLGSGTQTLTTNVLYNNASGNYNSQTAGGSDILDDPGYVSITDYRLRGSSPAMRAGTTGAMCADIRGRPCYGLAPNIGAYQSTSGDPAATRAARN